MRADAIVFGIAGTLFGLIIGWVLGSQQAGRTARVAAPVAQAAPASQQPPASPQPVADRSGARQGARGCRGAECQGLAAARAARQHVLRRRAIPAGDHVVRTGDRDQPERRQRLHRSGRRVLLHEPARSRAGAVRAVAASRSEAHQDAAERRHRPRVRQAGSSRRRRRPGSRWSICRRTLRRARRRRKGSTASRARIRTRPRASEA